MSSAVLTSISETWSKVNFNVIKNELDVKAAEIAERQDASEISRRTLVEQTKEFKRNTAEEVRKLVIPLLRSFQHEVDRLSKRSKAAETDVLSVYRQLIDLPDPVQAFEAALQLQKKVQHTTDLEIECRQLRETLANYNSELAEVRNQEVTVKTLREQVRSLEENLDSAVGAGIRERERELSLRFAEKERDLAHKQLEIAQKLGEAEQKVSGLQASMEALQSELLDVRSRLEETQTAKADETEMLLADCERANERASCAEREVDSLRSQLRNAGDSFRAADDVANVAAAKELQMRQAELEMELQSKERETAQLVEDVRRLQAALQQLRDSSAQQVQRLEEELTARQRALDQSEAKLRDQADYDEIKRELGILRSVEFSAVDASSENGKSLEQLLLEKNRSLQNELTQTKVANQQLNESNALLTAQLHDSETLLETQRELINQLEEDLHQVKAFSAQFRGAAEGQDESEAGVNSAEADLLLRAVPQLQSAATDKTSAKADGGADATLLPIVQSQRERFRVRAQELEAQSIAQQQQMQFLTSEMDKIRSDNVKLYEKIKFLQSYNSREGGDDTIMSRYSGAYEERLDPFTNFSRKERMRKYVDLKAHDKVTLSMGRLIMGNKIARGFVFFYTLFLHLLVFLVLYKLAHAETCRRDAAIECQQEYAQHMRQAHGHKSLFHR